MEKQIIVIKPKSLSAKDKEKLTKAGNIVIEHQNPHEMVYRMQHTPIPFIYILCANCGDRIYMTEERKETLMKNKYQFFCTHGHKQSFK